ncbi:MAG: hypothetical protein AAF736_18785 [Pseudomonadota bacterium]
MQNSSLLGLITLTACATASAEPRPPFFWEQGCDSNLVQCVDVTGVGVHLFSTAQVHSQAPTDTGFIQRSTDIIELDGDLQGRVLYHPISEFDFAAGTLVNTGHQVFSGTVLGSEPVLIVDNSYRFDVDLQTGFTEGRVRLESPIAGPRIQCRLNISGDGTRNENGDAAVAYTGTCRFQNPPGDQ